MTAHHQARSHASGSGCGPPETESDALGRWGRPRVPGSLLAANITGRLDEGVRVVAGGKEECAKLGRTHEKRAMSI